MALAAARAPSERQEKAAGTRSGTSDPASPKSSWAAFEAALFVQALHGEGVGFARLLTVSSCRRAYDYHRPASEAAWAARRHACDRDCYIGLNAYRRPRGPLAGIRALYVDLDYYNVPKWRASEPRDLLASVLTALEKIGIPAPGLAVATGRGLQLVWVITPVKLQAAPKANTAMQRLTKVLVDFGADRPAQILPACLYPWDREQQERQSRTAPHPRAAPPRFRLPVPDYPWRAGLRLPKSRTVARKGHGQPLLVHKRLSASSMISLGVEEHPERIPQPRGASRRRPPHSTTWRCVGQRDPVVRQVDRRASRGGDPPDC